MPFVSIRLLSGRPQSQKDAIARGVNEAIAGVTGLPPDKIWITFEEIGAADWYAAGVSAASAPPMPGMPGHKANGKSDGGKAKDGKKAKKKKK